MANETSQNAYVPKRKEPRFKPFRMIIYTEAKVFSPPRSPLMRDGQPYVLIASRNTSSTVLARLFVLTRKPVTCPMASALNAKNEKARHLPFDNTRQQYRE